MKKLILIAILFYGVSCTNPEDHVNNNTDSAHNANTENTTTNTPPGPYGTSESRNMKTDTSSMPVSDAGAGTKTDRAGVANQGMSTKKDSSK